ncbi:MAG: class I SAM-dependent methyltransferase, partial [Dehalococcoidales bacterium]|nr:class I SAM-dependent methyltransferase [Dehalococcoidales bacterium]
WVATYPLNPFPYPGKGRNKKRGAEAPLYNLFLVRRLHFRLSLSHTNIMSQPYSRLSQVYDAGWGDFSIQYIDWIKALLQERHLTQARILDLACGTGILAVALAKCGHIVHGIDTSPEMISQARSKAVGLGNASFAVQDMVRFSVTGQFDLVACTFDSINYLRRLTDLRRMLSRVAAVLGDGGLFIFDSNTEKLYQSHSDETRTPVLNGQSLIQRCVYDPAHKLATTTFSFPDGTYEIHRQRPYGLDELQPRLMRAGLRVIQQFSWFDILPYTPETAKLFCAAEKITPRQKCPANE